MTKKEAMAFAISTGRPITHTTFGSEEYVRFEGKDLIDEDGLVLPACEFWGIRLGGIWESGWTEYKQ